MRVGLFPNIRRDNRYKFTYCFAGLLKTHNIKAVIDDTVFPDCRDENLTYGSYEDCDLMVSLGGDGTFLSAAHKCRKYKIPLTGINLGNVGFLTEIGTDMLAEAASCIAYNRFTVEERMLLEVEFTDAETGDKVSDFALNDAVLFRDGFAQTIKTTLCINESVVENISSDGIIISTPTGSTAYSLAAGGPIVEPKMRLFLITPVCPHALNTRTYVADEEAIIKVRLSRYSEPAVLSLDGRAFYRIRTGQEISIGKAEEGLKFVDIWHNDFYKSLSEKIKLRGTSI